MIESWKHKVIRKGLEAGHSIMRIYNDTRLSVGAILREIDSDINLKIYTL